MGAVASFYSDGCCTCPVPEWDSAGGWTPWLLLSLRSSGSWGWDSPFESVWGETEMKLSIGEHGRIGKKRSSVGPVVNRKGRDHLVGTSHLIQSQSTVMVSHSLKDLFAFLAFSLGQSQCRPIQFISLACLKKFFFTYMAALGLSCGPFDLCCGMRNLQVVACGI